MLKVSTRINAQSKQYNTTRRTTRATRTKVLKVRNTQGTQ